MNEASPMAMIDTLPISAKPGPAVPHHLAEAGLGRMR